MDYKLINQKLDELNLDGYKQIKNNDWVGPKELINWLKEKGFEKVGEGMFSAVYYSKTESFVVKVNKGEIDTGYLKFVDFCQSNKGNPHLPKLGKIKKYDDWYIIFIEKLDELKEDYNTNTVINILKALNDGEDITDKNNFVKLYNIQNKKNYKDYNDLIKNAPYGSQLFDVFVLLKNMMKECGIDYHNVHSNNIMSRKNTLVITDPFM